MAFHIKKQSQRYATIIKIFQGLIPGIFTGTYHVIIHMFLAGLCHRGIKNSITETSVELDFSNTKDNKTIR